MSKITPPTTEDEFKAMVASVEEPSPFAFGLGVATVDKEGRVLDTRFLETNFGEDSPGTAAVMRLVLGALETGQKDLSQEQIEKLLEMFGPYRELMHRHPNVKALHRLKMWMKGHEYDRVSGERHLVPVLAWVDSADDAVVTAVDGWLKLTMISQQKVLPTDVSRKGIFDAMTNCVWSEQGPIPLEGGKFAEMQLERWMSEGHVISPYADDFFPPMMDYVQPAGVRIADAKRVRLGAHLAPKTTVMHEGFCNAFAGTRGKCMLEGRLSMGVLVGKNSDIGGGSSTLGTLSGGNDIVVSIGEGCQLDANSGLGIPIGNAVRVSVVEYPLGSVPILVTGSRDEWMMNPQETQPGLLEKLCNWADSLEGWVKGEELFGIDHAIFRRNNKTGRFEVVPRCEKTWGSLNDMLHDRN